jgi:hypothetical protein
LKVAASEPAQLLAVGDTTTAPAGVPHYLAARGATIIFITVMGPYDMVYVNPAQQPGRPFPYGYYGTSRRRASLPLAYQVLECGIPFERCPEGVSAEPGG